MELSKDIVICGAGIAGVSAAYHLAVKHKFKDILLIDQNSPLSLTSDHSSECYRNWWPGPGDAMVRLMNRSIDLLEELAHETSNKIQLSRRGYLFLTGDQNKISIMLEKSGDISRLGAGPLRIHRGRSDDPPYKSSSLNGFMDEPSGADFFTDSALIKKHFPFLTNDVAAAIHIRRAGWLSAQQLGICMLEKARESGVQFFQRRLTGIEIKNHKISSIMLEDGTRVNTNIFVNAAGPFIADVCKMMDVELPVFSEKHLKIVFKDHLEVVPRNVPMLIWTDSQYLNWNQDDIILLKEDPQSTWLLDEFPPGVHTRPEGGEGSQILIILWEYDLTPVEPVFPVTIDDQYPEIVLRGLSRMIPGIKKYLSRIPRPLIDGGYYTKTRENRPLIGKLPVEGAYIIGAFSGFGIMVACGAGDLLAQDIAGKKLPEYAAFFNLNRYKDPEYQNLLEQWGESGQI